MEGNTDGNDNDDEDEDAADDTSNWGLGHDFSDEDDDALTAASGLSSEWARMTTDPWLPVPADVQHSNSPVASRSSGLGSNPPAGDAANAPSADVPASTEPVASHGVMSSP